MTQTLDSAVQHQSAARPEQLPAWKALKDAACSLQTLQAKDGSVADHANVAAAGVHVDTIVESLRSLGPLFPHDAA